MVDSTQIAIGYIRDAMKNFEYNLPSEFMVELEVFLSNWEVQSSEDKDESRMSEGKYPYTIKKIISGTNHRAEYHIIIEVQADEDIPDDRLIEKYLVSKLADKMMVDLINGFGGRGVSIGDVYLYNQKLQQS